MLVLERTVHAASGGDKIIIGDDIEVVLISIKGKKAKIGVNAPQEIPVHRAEVYNLIHRMNQEADERDGTTT